MTGSSIHGSVVTALNDPAYVTNSIYSDANECYTTERDINPYVRIDLGQNVQVGIVQIFTKQTQELTLQAEYYDVWVSDGMTHYDGKKCISNLQLPPGGSINRPCEGMGRFVTVTATDEQRNTVLSICEIMVKSKGPEKVEFFETNIGESFEIPLEGLYMKMQDRIRLIEHTSYCGANKPVEEKIHNEKFRVLSEMQFFFTRNSTNFVLGSGAFGIRVARCAWRPGYAGGYGSIKKSSDLEGHCRYENGLVQNLLVRRWGRVP